MTTLGDKLFPSMSPSEIYRQLTEGPGPWTLRDAQEVTSVEQTQEHDRAEMITSLAKTIRSGWQGDAGTGAYGAAMPLAERAFENSEKLNHSQDLLSRQVDSFSTAFNSVRPVSDPPVSSMDEKFPFDVDYEKSVTEYQDSAQHNIAVYRSYDGASHYNETNMPQEFNNNTRAAGDVSVRAPADTIEVDAPGPRAGRPLDGGDPPGPGTSGPDGPRRGGAAGPVTSGFPGDPGGSRTSPSEHHAAPRPSPPLPFPSPGQPSPVSASPGGFVGGVPFRGQFGGGGFGPRGGGGDGGFGPRGGGGVAGGTPRLGQGGPGLGVGGLAAEEARRAAQAAAATGRGGGMGAMGTPVGAGRGKGDEDAEHQRKVLIEADAEDIFGSDALTAPEVIGDDEYED